MFKKIGEDDDFSGQFVDTWAEESSEMDQTPQTPATVSSLRSMLRGEQPTHEPVHQFDNGSSQPEQLHSEYTVIQIADYEDEVVEAKPSRFRIRFRK
jgi:hypothetical protein